MSNNVNGYSIHDTIINITNTSNSQIELTLSDINVKQSNKTNSNTFFKYTILQNDLINSENLKKLYKPTDISSNSIDIGVLSANCTMQLRISCKNEHTIQFSDNIKTYITHLFSLSKNLINIDNLFANCTNLSYIDPRASMTKSMTSAVSAFFNCISITNIPSTFTFGGNVSSFISCFANCTQLTGLHNNPINASIRFYTNTVYAQNMFKNCISLKTIPENSFKITSNLINLSGMFENCSSLIELPSSFNLNGNLGIFDQLTNSYNGSCANMFKNCTSLTGILNHDFKLPFTTNYSNMFENCDLLYRDISTIFPGQFNTLNCITNQKNKPYVDIQNIFKNCQRLFGNAPAGLLWFLDKHYNEYGTQQETNIFKAENAFKNCIGLSNFKYIPRYWGGKIYPANCTVLRVHLDKYAPEFNKLNWIQEFQNIIPNTSQETSIYWGDNNLTYLVGNSVIKKDLRGSSETIYLNNTTGTAKNVMHTYDPVLHKNIQVNPFTSVNTLYVSPKENADGPTVSWHNSILFIPSENQIQEDSNNILYLKGKNNGSIYYENRDFKFEFIVVIKNCKTFNSSSINNNIVEVLNLAGDLQSCYSMFKDSLKLTEVYDYASIPNRVSDCSCMFENCINLRSVGNFVKFGLSVRFANSMFKNCNRLQSVRKIFSYRKFNLAT